MSFIGEVSGTVERVLTGGRTPGVVVKYHEDGAQYPDRVTVWLNDNDAPHVGESVIYSGTVRVRLSKPNAEGKVYANATINNPERLYAGGADGPNSGGDFGGGPDGEPF